MPFQLERPESEGELYLARGDEVDHYRPIMQGDVFGEVAIPGISEHAFAMVITHPCTIRGRDGRLRPLIQMAPVVSYQPVALEAWPDGHYKVCPLPGLDPARPSVHFAARLDEAGMVSSSELSYERRVACLSERGVLLLQQRHIFSLTRADIPIRPHLEQASMHVLVEAELQEDWNLKLVGRRVERGDDFALALRDECIAFDRFLGEPTEAPLREQLKTEHLQAGVRRVVRQEIDRRLEAL